MITMLQTTINSLPGLLNYLYFYITFGQPFLGAVILLVLFSFIMWKNNFPTAIFSTILAVTIFSIARPEGLITSIYSIFNPFLIIALIVIGAAFGYVFLVTFNKQ